MSRPPRISSSIRLRRSAAATFCAVASLLAASAIAQEEGLKTGPGREEAAVFENQIRPLLRQRCFDCHGSDAPQADLDLSAFADERRF
jgi:hypothetical protein